MSDTLDTSRARRLAHTPLRDLLRGQVTARLDWKRRLAASPLPRPAVDAIGRVVRRTRLWRSEKAEVAHELIAHFTDGIASGASVEALVRDFGDERAAAKLIRRAKRRNRPVAWHASRALAWGVIVLLAVYGTLEIRFLLGRATPRVDYTTVINAATNAVTESDRGWPLFRRAILALQEKHDSLSDGEEYLFDAEPRRRRWPELQAWLAAHAEAIALARAAAAKPILGFVFGPAGSRVDPEMAAAFPNQNWTAVVETAHDTRGLDLLGNREALLSNVFGGVIQVLGADAVEGRSRGDAPRVADDVEALLGVAQQYRTSKQPSELDWTSEQAYRSALDTLAATLSNTPNLLDDAALIRLAHRLSPPRTAADLIDFESTRLRFLDFVQKAYTDNGAGDGRLTLTGVQMLTMFHPYNDPTTLNFWRAGMTQHLLPFSAIGDSRKEATAEFERVLKQEAALLASPRRDANWDALFEPGDSHHLPRLRDAKSIAVLDRARSFQNDHEEAERMLGQRDGVLVGIALEIYHREHGTYPSTLDALTPTLLPRVPEDRFTGGPVKYRLIDGRPVIYSVGVDLKDDNGHFLIDSDGTPHPRRASRWTPEPRGATDGDWILFDCRPQK